MNSVFESGMPKSTLGTDSIVRLDEEDRDYSDEELKEGKSVDYQTLDEIFEKEAEKWRMKEAEKRRIQQIWEVTKNACSSSLLQ